MKKIRKSMDGNEAASYISYAFTETAAIYPITPSSPMATHVDEWSANGLKNIFGTQVRIVEMQAEAGACPYGGLDYCTLGIVKDKFDAWCSPASEDAALAKAVELLK